MQLVVPLPVLLGSVVHVRDQCELGTIHNEQTQFIVKRYAKSFHMTATERKKESADC